MSTNVALHAAVERLAAGRGRKIERIARRFIEGAFGCGLIKIVGDVPVLGRGAVPMPIDPHIPSEIQWWLSPVRAAVPPFPGEPIDYRDLRVSGADLAAIVCHFDAYLGAPAEERAAVLMGLRAKNDELASVSEDLRFWLPVNASRLRTVPLIAKLRGDNLGEAVAALELAIKAIDQAIPLSPGSRRRFVGSSGCELSPEDLAHLEETIADVIRAALDGPPAAKVAALDLFDSEDAANVLAVLESVATAAARSSPTPTVIDAAPLPARALVLFAPAAKRVPEARSAGRAKGLPRTDRDRTEALRKWATTTWDLDTDPDRLPSRDNILKAGRRAWGNEFKDADSRMIRKELATDASKDGGRRWHKKNRSAARIVGG